MSQFSRLAVAAALSMPLTSAAMAQNAPPPAAAATPPPAAATPPPAATEELPAVNVVQETPQQKAAKAKKKAVAVSPLSSAPATPTAEATAGAAVATPGASTSATPLPTVPSATTTVSDDDIKREGTMQIQQALQQQVPGIIISDAAGNPLRAEVSFRGFDASPVSGRSQGLAVYQNGVRINEAFGDTVQWDVIPSNAIASTSVVSNNPSFGLNALGGAVSIMMKDGFSYQGGEIDVMAGSFGRAQVGMQAGVSSGGVGLYVAGEGITDDSFRDFSDSEVKRFYGDLGFKGEDGELHFSLTAAKNHFGASSAAPVELLQRSWSNTFTVPQTTDLEVLMPTISGTIKATETLSFSGVGYYRHYKNRVLDGNITEADACAVLPAGAPGVASDYLCLDEGTGDVLRDESNFQPINVTTAGIDEPFATLDRLTTDSKSWGGALEAQEKAKLFDRPNLFIAGLSYDHGRSDYKTSSELGTIGPGYVVEGSGIIITDAESNVVDPNGPNEVGPRDLATENTYYGLYFSNALDVTDRLTVTVGGRYNHATIKLEDKTGLFPDLNVTNKYDRFNPQVGANYKLVPGLSVYGGYSESNRAPTPAELGCAEPDAPCLVEGFLTDDPPLKQVVGRTGEVGLRGQSYVNGGDRFAWSAGLFRTLASDDILPITDAGGRVYFTNAGDTLRQGVELSATYEARRWSTYASYAFIDATLDSCNDPSGECAFLESGDRLPGIPRHRFKAGFDYWLTPKWKFGADLIAADKSPFYPNEVSDDLGISAKLPGYARVDLHTSYDVTENFQIYGLVKNLFDRRYGLYGTFFEAADIGPEVDEVINPGQGGLSDPRSVSPAMPFAAYGGVKIKF